MMSSVGEAAKAALYMKGGQIDGVVVAIRTCEPPENLPAVAKREDRSERRSGERRSFVAEDRYADERRSSSRYNQPDEQDSRRSSNPSWPKTPNGTSRGIHPDRQRFISDGDQRYDLNQRNSIEKDSDGRPKKMRRWGQPDVTHSSTNSHRKTRRERSTSRSRSPQSHQQEGSSNGRRRLSGAMRASPSY